MPYVSEHAARIEPPDKFERYRRENDKLGEGIDVIWGIDADGKAHIQSIRFDARRYSIEDVRRWLKEHGYEAAEIEPARRAEMSDYERDARLIVAGDYPDKGIRLTEQDLDELIEQSDTDIPVIVEHRPTLVLGWVKQLWRVGSELWGKLRLKPPAAELIADSPVRGLSVGISTGKPYKLHEVSLTATPRVPTARIFSDDPQAEIHQPEIPHAELYIVRGHQSPDGGTTMENKTTGTQSEPIQDRAESERIQELEVQLARTAEQLQFTQRLLLSQTLDRLLDQWQERGKLTPAAAHELRPLALELASQADGNALIQFAQDQDHSVLPHALACLIRFVESLPDQPQRSKPVRYVGIDNPDLAKSQLQQQLAQAGFSLPLSDDTVNSYLKLNGGDQR